MNLAPNASSLAALLRMARHVADQTAADSRDQGNVEPLEPQDFDRFKTCPHCGQNNRSLICECKQMLPEIHVNAMDRSLKSMRQKTDEMRTLTHLYGGHTSRDREEAQPKRAKTRRSQHWKRCRQKAFEARGLLATWRALLRVRTPLFLLLTRGRVLAKNTDHVQLFAHLRLRSQALCAGGRIAIWVFLIAAQGGGASASGSG